MKRSLLFFIILFFIKPVFAENNSSDSLKKLIQAYHENGNKSKEAEALFELGSEIIGTAQVGEALSYLKSSSEIYLSLHDSINYAWCLYKISYLYNLTGDYSKSFTYCLNANSIASSYSLKSLEGYCQNLMGRLYYLLSDENSAMSFYDKALKNGIAEKDNRLIAESMSYIAIVWRNRDSLSLSLKMQLEALELRVSVNNESDCALSYFNIGILYSYRMKNDSAIYWLTKAESIWIKNNDYFNLAECYNYLGKAYLKLNDISLAENYFMKSLDIALKVRAKKMIRYNYYDLAMINYKKGDNKKAIDQILLYTLYKDSVVQDQGLLEITHLQAQSMKEKNENAIKLLNKENELKASQLAKNRIVIWTVAIGLLLVLLLSIFIFRSLRITLKQKKIIQDKNKDITNSIYYAKRIQQSQLPTEKYIEKELKRLKNPK